MKLLLDECLPHSLRRELPGHAVFTVRYSGFAGKKNGELLRLAAQHEFDALLTLDAGLQFEQDVHDLPISVIVLRSRLGNDTEVLRQSMPRVLGVLRTMKARTLVRIDCDE